MTNQEHERQPGSWIGRKPDENTEQVRSELGPDDERVAVTDTESSGEGSADERVQGRDDEWPSGHREGDAVSDDDVRRAGGEG
jgi:hypothetical protein